MTKSKIEKEQAAGVLREISYLLELKNENIFKIRAFDNASRVLEGNPNSLKHLIETGELENLKGIGKGISAILHDLFQKGRSKDYDDLKKEFPKGIFELFQIPGLGAKRIKVLYDTLKIKSVTELERACTANKLTALAGFGDKSQEKILEGIRHFQKSSGQFLISAAKAEAEKFLAYLKKQPGVSKAEIAGSIRRHKEVIRDIDILISAKVPAKIHAAFLKYPGVEAVVAHGDTKSSVTLKSGMNCDLRTVTDEEFPYALYYFTGSKEHNVAVRTLAKKKKIKINEYGLFRASRLIRCRDESEIFKAVGLHDIPPEARENTGEIEWAMDKEFPRLVCEEDLRGVFHVHSTYSDGVGTLEDMIAEAERMGLEYVGISDHSQSAKYAKGLEPERVRKQWKEIDRLQKRFKIRIFKGTESDILGDGGLDYPDRLLSGFDFVIGSVHSRFNLPEKEQTERICRAMENKYLTMIGHPTGRLLLSRDAYPLDLGKVMDHAQKCGAVLELNAHPQRLDLDWRVMRDVKKQGVRLSINPDAHSLEGMKDISYGIGIARKAWLEKKDVVNTLSLPEMEKFLRRKR